MAGPFHNAICGTTASSPGTGAFTPNAAAPGFLAWSTVPTGWIGLVRYQDGSNWELSFGYWNGTTISRPSNILASSSGSRLSLSASATASLVVSGFNVAPAILGGDRGWIPLINGTTPTPIGVAAGTFTGTNTAVTPTTTNFLTEQARHQITSATTANAQSAFANGTNSVLVNTTAGRGGWMAMARFGASQLPSGPRLFVGVTSTSLVGNTGEPSALTANYATFAKDSTDTNIQLLTNSNAGTGTKIDTGIAMAANDWFHAQLWTPPGSTTVHGLLIKMNDGSIYYGSTSTDTPVNGAAMAPNVVSGLSATTGTAVIFHFGGFTFRNGGLL
jgi:hypothetical protein